MKHHIAFKFIAIALCAAALMSAGGSAIGAIFLGDAGLYDQDVDSIIIEQRSMQLQNVASSLAAHYASVHLGGVNESLYLDCDGPSYDNYVLESGKWYYTITDASGKVLDSTYNGEQTDMTWKITDLYADYITVIDTREADVYYETNTYAPAGLPEETAVTQPVIEESAPIQATEAAGDGLQAYSDEVPENSFWLASYDYETGLNMLYLLCRQPVIEESAPIQATEAAGDGLQAYSDEVPENSFWLASYDYETGLNMLYLLCRQPVPDYTVTLYLEDDAFLNDTLWGLLRSLWQHRYDLFAVFGVSLLLFAVLAVYLCCSAGRRPGSDEIKPAAFNCLPLDGYALAAGGGCFLLAALIASVLVPWLRYSNGVELLAAAGIALCVYAGCLLLVAFFYACAAQFKAGHGYWWRRSITGMCLLLAVRVVKWLWKAFVRFCGWLPPALRRGGTVLHGWMKLTGRKLKRLLLRIYHMILRFFRWAGKRINRFYSMLPLTWQWLLTGGIMVVLIYLSLRCGKVGWILVCLGSAFAIILYGTQAFGILLESAGRMSKGDLDTKVDDQILLGGFKAFAGHLNALAGVAVEAAKNQLKSERMKTELITNVSHDIKTPLTSIINFVDLLEKPHTPEQERQYLDVLSRQSHRLKKLIDDLMEMSKASTGNLTVNITQVDAIEAANQALGEFSDRLAAAQITPVFNSGEESIPMLADGRLVWRVLSNLLSNAVKYALPGTRLYVDVVKLEGKVLLSLKNISKEQLNISSDELMERFVRGDAARNTEGSGLGLNIAKSLMELQHGQLQLLVDGDLFKATLVFPTE